MFLTSISLGSFSAVFQLIFYNFNWICLQANFFAQCTRKVPLRTPSTLSWELMSQNPMAPMRFDRYPSFSWQGASYAKHSIKAKVWNMWSVNQSHFIQSLILKSEPVFWEMLEVLPHTAVWLGKWNISETLWIQLTYPSDKEPIKCTCKAEGKLGKWSSEPFVTFKQTNQFCSCKLEASY